MSARAQVEYRRAGKPVPKPKPPPGTRWYARLGLILLTVLLLSLSFAPFGQFYLAWVGLVPWLLMLRGLRSQRAAFLWGWLAGILFFTANMWWLAYVTGPGMVALMFLLGLYWAVTAVVIRGVGLLADDNENGGSRIEVGGTVPRSVPSSILHFLSSSPLARILLLPAIWVSLEWLRGNWPLNGLPWLFMGHGQTPVLAMCQVADALGVYGISFWVVAVNALVALFVIDRLKARRLVPAGIAVGAILMLVLGYGLWRMSQTDRLSPGPLVMVVQSNFPQSNTGEKGATVEELVEYHILHSRDALRQRASEGAGNGAAEPVDLLVWSETMMPHVNRSARDAFRGTDEGAFLEDVHELLADLTRTNHTALLTGAIYADKWTLRNGKPFASDRRNTAFFYDRAGNLAEDSSGRYDKVHIVPFGEYLPFKDTFPLLHGLFQSLSPYADDYFLTPGRESDMNVFRLELASGPTSAPSTSAAASRSPAWRFVTPICFEDIDPLLVAKMFRPRSGEPGKSADFIVNVTNDGWFRFNQMAQHLQAARFRSIENRAPTARSVNTGISGFIDSFGRTYGLIDAGIEGNSVQRLQLDSRQTLYTRYGDVFAAACSVVTIMVAGASVVRWRTLRPRLPGRGAGREER